MYTHYAQKYIDLRHLRLCDVCYVIIDKVPRYHFYTVVKFFVVDAFVKFNIFFLLCRYCLLSMVVILFFFVKTFFVDKSEYIKIQYFV